MCFQTYLIMDFLDILCMSALDINMKQTSQNPHELEQFLKKIPTKAVNQLSITFF